jgi:hypothetical protein
MLLGRQPRQARQQQTSCRRQRAWIRPRHLPAHCGDPSVIKAAAHITSTTAANEPVPVPLNQTLAEFLTEVCDTRETPQGKEIAALR